MKTWRELLHHDLAADAEEAAEYLRAALEDNDPHFFSLAVGRVIAARGGISDLPLSPSELASMVETLSMTVAPTA
jgi:DNA-binding phage protein